MLQNRFIYSATSLFFLYISIKPLIFIEVFSMRINFSTFYLKIGSLNRAYEFNIFFLSSFVFYDF